jgi:toxin ParE1/3/4
LSRGAEQDVFNLFVEGLERFGAKQAASYQEDLERCFALIAENPLMGRSATIRELEIRRHEHGSHVIFYRPMADHVLITAVVHARSLRHLTF